MGLFSKKKEDLPVPPKPPAPESSKESTSNKDLTPPSPNQSSLTAPPTPGGSLNDIKSQVSSSNDDNNNDNSNNGINNKNQIDNSLNQNNNLPDIPENSETEDDSLFDFSELDINSNSNNNNTENEETKNNDTLSFIKKDKKETENVNSTYFITTKQFKTLLETIDQVKRKVKESSETHLRLMDIKSEEDIEYENLRKDFEFIEEKLYEVDSIIFNN